MKSIVLDIASSLRGRRSKGREKGFRGRQAISPEKGTAKETPRGRVFPMELEKRAETELHYGLKYGKDNKNTT